MSISNPSQAFDRAEHCRRIAAAGGRATVARHGHEHMRRIGRRGFKATTARYFVHDTEAHKRWLARAGAHAYWRATGLPMKYDIDGRPLWPEARPMHPAETAAPGQLGLFERLMPLPF